MLYTCNLLKYFIVMAISSLYWNNVDSPLCGGAELWHVVCRPVVVVVVVVVVHDSRRWPETTNSDDSRHCPTCSYPRRPCYSEICDAVSQIVSHRRVGTDERPSIS